MPIITVCPECGCKIRTSEESAGKKVRCPECDESVVVGESSDDKQTEGKHAIQAERPQAKTDPASVSASRRPDDDDRPPEKRRRRDRDDDEDDDDERLRRRRRLRDRDDDDVDDGMTTLIPTGNPKALAAYYLGVFSLIPGLGMILGPLALIFGIKGKRFANANPKAKGWGHAIAGIVLGALTTFGHLTVILIVGIGIWYGTNKQKTENTEVQDRIAEIVKRSKEGGQPALPPPIKEEAPKVAQKMKPIDLPPTPLFKSTRDLLNPGRVLTVKPEAGLVAAVRVGSLQVTRVIFAPDAKTVAVNTSDGNLLIDMASSRTRPIDGEILAFSPDSASLVVIRRQAELSLLFL